MTEMPKQQQINEIKNEKEVTTATTETQRILGDYDEQLHANKMDNPEEMDKFLEMYNFTWLNQDENIKTPVYEVHC